MNFLEKKSLFDGALNDNSLAFKVVSTKSLILAILFGLVHYFQLEKINIFKGASLDLLGASHLIEDKPLRGFTMSCQAATGGFSKWPNYYPDVLHTYLGMCGLSIVGEPELEAIDSRFCLSVKALQILPHYKK